ncbi:hypothetical protein J3E68DRAFT_86980 [Trichoderma sp. SZMC 28012]
MYSPFIWKRIALAASLLLSILLFWRYITISDIRQRYPILRRPHESSVSGNISCFLLSANRKCTQILPGVTTWERPAHVSKVMALVFFGRRQTVSILDCYLKRNLVKNGGVLDGVIFVVRTKDAANLALLDKMVASEPAYERMQVDLKSKGYTSSYEFIQDDVMYIKMDDDIVYIEDTAIKAIASAKASRPDVYIMSANVVNQILFSWLHRNFGAVKPYLPELTERPADNDSVPLTDWRTSVLPSWEGPADFKQETWSAERHPKHRWLPVRGRNASYPLNDTPIAKVDYTFGYSHKHWQVAAQEHYSLLENLEKDELWRYRFPTWDFQLKRMGIQFVAMMGKDINLAKPIPPDDEHHFTVEMPTRLGRHAAADGTGVVAHFSYGPQSGNPGVQSTDLLDRYRLFARENICKGDLLWTPRDDSKS